MRPRQSIATGRQQAKVRFERRATRHAGVVLRAGIRVSSLALSFLATVNVVASAANPLSAIGETFSDWKDRLSASPIRPSTRPAEGTVSLAREASRRA